MGTAAYPASKISAGANSTSVVYKKAPEPEVPEDPKPAKDPKTPAA